MKALARRIAVPALLFVAMLAGGRLALNAWSAEVEDVAPEGASPRTLVRMQVEDDGGIGLLSDANENDAPSTIDGGIDDAITIDSPELLDSPPFIDAAPLFFDAPEPPGGQPGTGP
ncbi:MAG: hypothetical protein SFX73_32520 [Kofleriaceae bacterium]|nr:hypothetical protein [Kofleriaceae bacterium]